jgi:DNA helicase-2/ATP-dependent DNA helicase PcrA
MSKWGHRDGDRTASLCAGASTRCSGRADGGVTVVDWKTGPQPSGADAAHRALQVGAYALAYARLRGLLPDQVDAAFYYARTGTTVRPTLPDEAELIRLLGSIAD